MTTLAATENGTATAEHATASAEHATAGIAARVHGHGPTRVLLLHALTGGPDAADRPGLKGWWSPVFQPGAPLDPERCTVWCPNLPGSCYGTTVPLPRPSTREQARLLLPWLEALDASWAESHPGQEHLDFDLVLGLSLGGMVALELALQAPGRFKALAVAGCGGRGHAWFWGSLEIQQAILRNPHLPDDEAIALARHAAMLTFRTPGSLDARFKSSGEIRAWLHHHGRALAARFTREAYLAILDAMEAHDIGQGRGGLVQALQGLGAPLHVLGLQEDLLVPREDLLELVDAARQAGCLGGLSWLESPHGHDAFLIEYQQVLAWLEGVLHGDPGGGPC